MGGPRATGAEDADAAPPDGRGRGRETMAERRREGHPFALYENVAWESRFPGLVAGVTAAGPEADFGLGTVSPPTRFFEMHAALAEQLGFPVGILARQVHGARVVRLEGGMPRTVPGSGDGATSGPNGPHLYVAGRADGVVATRRGVLLTVTAADCIPVYVVDPEAEVLALLHAGWRGAAAGVLEAGLARAVEAGGDPDRLLVHMGPGICGECYAVGPEVPEALGLEGGTRVDLRDVLARRAARLGLPGGRVSRSSWCTRCARDRFHSHRGSRGRAGRMAAYLGWRAAASG